MVGSSGDSAGLSNIAKRIRSVEADITTVRTATVVSDSVAPEQTLVALDNDPSQTPINALSSYGLPLPKGTRVACIAYPPRGLLVLGPFEDQTPAPVIPTISQYTGGPTSVPYPGDQYQFVTIEGCGGGGAGGGAQGAGVGAASGGAGGGAAMWGRSRFRVDALNWPLSITAGAGGVGVAGAAGGNGARSQVNDAAAVKIWCAEGGVGGGIVTTAGAVGAAAIGGTGGADGGTQFLFQSGAFGGDGSGTQKQVATPMIGGTGGASAYGGGGQGRAQSNGTGGNPPGAGGGGASVFNNGTAGAARTGGNGQVGIVAVYYE